MSRVLVISPHPDDESIGCGGTLRKHAVERDEVRVVFLTSGEGGGHGRQADETVRVREQEARSAAAILGISIPTFWRGPDGALSVTHELVNRLHSDLVEWRPEVVYVTHPREMHRDHRAAAHPVRRAVSEL